MSRLLKNLLALLMFICFMMPTFSQTLPKLIPFRDGEEWGYADTLLRLKIKPQWTNAYPFVDGKAIVTKNNESYRINTNGKIIQKLNFQVMGFEMGLGNIVMPNGKQGYINGKAEIVIPPTYTIADPFGLDSIAYVKWEKEGKQYTGQIDMKGNVLDNGDANLDEIFLKKIYFLAKPHNDSLLLFSSFSCGLALANKEGKYGFVNTHGDVIIPFIYDYAEPFNNGLAKVIFNEHPNDIMKHLSVKEGTPVMDVKYLRYSDGYIDTKGREYFTSGKEIEAMTVYGQTTEIQKNDSGLTAIRKNWLSEILQYNNSDSTFKKLLLRQLTNPITFNNTLDSLSKYILIKSSADKKVNFYSWDNLSGGTWHSIISITRFKSEKDKIIVQELSSGNESETGKYTDSGIYEVHDIFINNRKYYLTFGAGTHGNGNQHNIVQIFTIEGDSLIKCKACFENSNDLVIEYPRSKKSNLTFNSMVNEISYNEFILYSSIDAYEFIEKIVTLKLRNGIFVNK